MILYYKCCCFLFFSVFTLFVFTLLPMAYGGVGLVWFWFGFGFWFLVFGFWFWFWFWFGFISWVGGRGFPIFLLIIIGGSDVLCVIEFSYLLFEFMVRL